MKKGGGKAKGSAFERMVCERLSLCVTQGANRDVFWRSAMSGGRGTLLKKRGKMQKGHQAGDISAVAPEGHCLTDKVFVECKFYKDLSLLSFFLGQPRGTLWQFWTKVKEQAKTHARDPLLIAKQNNVPTLAITNTPPLIAGAARVMPLCMVYKHQAYVYEFDSLFPNIKPALRGTKNESTAGKRPTRDRQAKRRIPLESVRPSGGALCGTRSERPVHPRRPNGVQGLPQQRTRQPNGRGVVPSAKKK